MALSKPTRIIVAFVLIVLIGLGITGLNYYLKYFGGNVTDRQKYLYIKTGSAYGDVYHTLQEQGILKDTTSFQWVAAHMEYTRIKPGKYRLQKGMNNRTLINMLKAGNQEPVRISFRNLRLKEDFAKYVSANIEADSASVMRLLDSSDFVGKKGFTTDNIFTMFIPNTYELWWNTSAREFFDRMSSEYSKFWTPARREKAQKIGLSPIEVTTLASIVDAEALHDEEMPAVAGLYMNRLNKGIKLESDPTVIFAQKDFTIRRVLNKYLIINSPYNTYMYAGLPPGPIMMPSIRAIDAVLNYQKHNYLYMCAKEDFSGYHNFASNHADHIANARRFQKALNDRKIMH
ncbi:MAG: endolytic transglycosylase MltG [Mucilaginibacter polytrichastri]|nr:endolytic transglycosylase MltG [Mucilaginibacter polytrichastri]